MTVLLDDHLLRDWMARRDDTLVGAIADEPLATTNLWYARLCKSAASVGGGGLLGGWNRTERQKLIGSLVALPDEVTILPMRQLAWTMGDLIATYGGLSTLGAEAIAALQLQGGLLVSARDDGPGIRRCCGALGLPYRVLAR